MTSHILGKQLACICDDSDFEAAMDEDEAAAAARLVSEVNEA